MFRALLVLLVPLALSAPGGPPSPPVPSNLVLDPEVNDTLEEFEERFHLPKITDPKEHARREKTLMEHEEQVKTVNKDFLAGRKSWYDAINEFSDLPVEEFEQEKTGAKMPESRYGRGLLTPTESERVDVKSEVYFAMFRASMKEDRASVPSSYSAVEEGLVSPVRDQGQCGSCVAFASMATIETCFKKKTGVFGDYSEQQMVDCGYDGESGNGCNGAAPHAYIKWAHTSKADLLAETTYPYANTSPSLTCPTGLAGYKQGARVSGSYYTYSGDEDTLKALVAEHGAVVTGVAAAGPFMLYKGGIFAGCTSQEPDHAITVVGYGTKSGLDYWLVKNSWGPKWGESGFIRLKRGVGMCGIGGAIAIVKCEKVAGSTVATTTTVTATTTTATTTTTEATTTTKVPCEDEYPTECPHYASTYDWFCGYYGEVCKKTCKVC